MDSIIMLFVTAFLALVVAYKAELLSVNDGFFDQDNTKALRGFWCLVVIMVHVPAVYSNRIQDLIGSLAYIGVTFFFMTSGYGLTISTANSPNGTKGFWRRRLPKLIIVNLVLYFLGSLVYTLLLHATIGLNQVINANKWLVWLIACYFVFWIADQLFKNVFYRKLFTILTIFVCSVMIYFLQMRGIIAGTTWTTECYGFIWGVTLASFRLKFIETFSDKWLVKLVTSCCIALILGLLYLKLKPVPFWGDYILKIILGLAITLFVLIANTRVVIRNKLSLFLGSISLEIFLAHGYVLDLLNGIRQWGSSALYIVSAIILTVLIAYIAHLFSNNLLVRTDRLLQINRS